MHARAVPARCGIVGGGAADRLDAEVSEGIIDYADAIAELSASHRLSPHIAKRYLQLAHKRALAAADESDE